MTTFNRSVLAASFIAIAISGTPQRALATQSDVDSEPVAQRILAISSQQLEDPNFRRTLRNQIGKAAREVCRRQYSMPATYHHSRSCYSRTYRDGIEQLDLIASRQANRGAVAVRTAAIVVRAQ